MNVVLSMADKQLKLLGTFNWDMTALALLHYSRANETKQN